MDWEANFFLLSPPFKYRNFDLNKGSADEYSLLLSLQVVIVLYTIRCIEVI